jgi:16S rRNA (guanine966-N2)-methyltransferase
MRIAGGEFRGRTVRTPRGDAVRPTQDRVREALFSMLLAELPGARFLDLYAGTGAVGIEALGRGAGDVVWVERDRATARVASANIGAIAGEPHLRNLVVTDVERYARGQGRDSAFDIVFADPPYADALGDGLASLCALLRDCNVVAQQGLLIVETPLDAPVPSPDGWTTLRDRAYGKTRLVIRQRNT